jgi:hypothetical protein
MSLTTPQGLRSATFTPAEAREQNADVHRFVCVVITVMVLGQRLALPAGGALQVPLTEAALLAMVGYAVVRGILVFHAPMTVIYLALVGVSAAATLAQAFYGLEPHTSSLVFLWILYAPVCLKLWVPDPRAVFDSVLGYFVRMMTWVGGAGLVLFAAQFGGLAYRDWLAAVIPTKLLISGYVTTYPIYFGSSIYRNNGVLFLEASSYSFWVGVAFVICVYRRERPWRLVLFAAALVSAESGNGLAVVAVALATLLVTGKSRSFIRTLLPIGIVLAIGAATPVGSGLVGRFTESGNSESSTSMRMIVPYQIFMPKIADSGPLLLFGHGAGSTNDAVKIVNLIYPMVPKILYDFGVPFALVFFALIFGAAATRVPWLPLTLALYVSYVWVNGGVLSALEVATMLVFVWWWPPDRPHGAAPPRPPHEVPGLHAAGRT